jgi:cytidylate kinase
MLVGILTISASYGAGGSIIAPAVAEKLGLPLIRRAIASDVAAQMAGPLMEAVADEEHGAGPLSRLFSRTFRVLSQGTYFAVPLTAEEEDELRDQLQAGMEEAARRGGAVILAPAALFVVGSGPDTLHVRLDGPVERRCERAAIIEQVDLETAKARQRDTDTARSLYVRHFYGASWDDPQLYHLVVDTTCLPLEKSVELIVSAARARFATASEVAP